MLHLIGVIMIMGGLVGIFGYLVIGYEVQQYGSIFKRSSWDKYNFDCNNRSTSQANGREEN